MGYSPEKRLVEAQREKQKADQVMLDVEAREQRAHVATLEYEVGKLRNEQSTLTNEVACLERDRKAMRAAKDFFEGEARRLPCTWAIAFVPPSARSQIRRTTGAPA